MDYITSFLLLCGSVLVSTQAIQLAVREREKNRHRNRQYALNEMRNMSPKHFKRMFRMDRDTFMVLLRRLEEYWGDRVDSIYNERFAISSSGSSISAMTRLAVTLRFLAGGSYLDICFAFGVAPGSFYANEGILCK